VPWGISESAFNVVDRHDNYQYKAFGVPGLGLKRGLADELVVAPYATALAAMVDPGLAARNFRRLAREGADGALGFYEAIDYTHRKAPGPGLSGDADGAGAGRWCAHSRAPSGHDARRARQRVARAISWCSASTRIRACRPRAAAPGTRPATRADHQPRPAEETRVAGRPGTGAYAASARRTRVSTRAVPVERRLQSPSSPTPAAGRASAAAAR
jgi:hypothetical protein